jgi:DhnA family fructose-bisphosphate aldolase class Ia
MSKRVDEILSWYESDHPGVLKNLRWMMDTGALAGTGKFVILPVDQGFEHGPAPASTRAASRSFSSSTTATRCMARRIRSPR